MCKIAWVSRSRLNAAGNSGFSWSDVLLGDLPNVYVYAANNPSESIIAKRRGYGTIVSHNVPPYGRFGAAPCPMHPFLLKRSWFISILDATGAVKDYCMSLPRHLSWA